MKITTTYKANETISKIPVVRTLTETYEIPDDVSPNDILIEVLDLYLDVNHNPIRPTRDNIIEYIHDLDLMFGYSPDNTVDQILDDYCMKYDAYIGLMEFAKDSLRSGNLTWNFCNESALVDSITLEK